MAIHSARSACMLAILVVVAQTGHAGDGKKPSSGALIDSVARESTGGLLPEALKKGSQAPSKSGPGAKISVPGTTVVAPIQPLGIGPGVRVTPTRNRLKLQRIGTAEVTSVRQVTYQGEGSVQYLNLVLSVEVINEGETEAHYKLVTVVPGAPRNHVSDSYQVAAGAHQRTVLRISSRFSLRSGSQRLPISVKLTNLAGREMGQLSTGVDMSSALGALAATQPGSPSNTLSRSSPAMPADLALANPRISIWLPPDFEFGRTIAQWAGSPAEGATYARVSVRNAGTERWGYPGRVSVRYSGGRPGAMFQLEGAVGTSADLPRGLRPGESADVTLTMPRALNPGFYYVARLRIESDQDESAVNNTAEISFFVEENGSVTTSGGGL